jgi:hypothetical protein
LTRIAISGHRELSPDIEALIVQGVQRELNQLTPVGPNLVGLSCLADGADQIFASAVLAHGGTLEVVVPAEEYRSGLPESAKARYDELIGNASAVYRRPHRESNSEAHMDASRFMIENADHLIAVWDGKPARSYGGTADVVAYAREKGIPVSVVWPEGATR